MQEVEEKRFRVAFLGRGVLGYRVLTSLLNNNEIEVCVIFTCRATPEVEFDESHFEDIASEKGIPLYRTNNINKPEWVDVLSRVNADLGVAMLWVNTIGDQIIQTARLGFLNCHGGLLPRYRGNACSNWALLNGETEQGVTVHLMEPGKLDSGPVILQEKIPISDETTIKVLMDYIMDRGAHLVIEAVDLMRTGRAQPKPQDEGNALYCYPRLPRDGEIDWNKSARDILALIRAAGDPYPGAYSYFADVLNNHQIRKLVIDEASVGEHSVDFCAVPGHLLKLDNGSKRGVVCGDKKLLMLHRIRIDDRREEPQIFFRSVRQRFGLDTETLLNEMRREATGDLIKTADNFLQHGHKHYEELYQAVVSIIEKVANELNKTSDVVIPNPTRNYSFQKRFYQWENQERWFGIQIYRSVRFQNFAGEPLALGYWLCSEAGQGLRQRIYVSLKKEYSALYSKRTDQLLVETFASAAIQRCLLDEETVYSWFVDVTGLEERSLQSQLLKLGRQIILLGDNGDKEGAHPKTPES